MESRIGNYRAYLLNAKPEYLTLTNNDRTTFLQEVEALRNTLTDARAKTLLDQLSTAEATRLESGEVDP